MIHPHFQVLTDRPSLLGWMITMMIVWFIDDVSHPPVNPVTTVTGKRRGRKSTYRGGGGGLGHLEAGLDDAWWPATSCAPATAASTSVVCLCAAVLWRHEVLALKVANRAGEPLSRRSPGLAVTRRGGFPPAWPQQGHCCMAERTGSRSVSKSRSPYRSLESICKSLVLRSTQGS